MSLVGQRPDSLSGSDTILTCNLRNDNGAHVGKVDISTKIISLAVREQRADVEEALTRLGSTPNLLIPHYTGVDGNTLAPVGDLVTSLLKGIDVFADLIGVLSEVRPDGCGVETRPRLEYRFIRMPRQHGASWTVFDR